jgi:uncharacterized protein (DUF3820 family)
MFRTKKIVIRKGSFQKREPYTGELQDYVFTFGVHQGKKLNEVPVSYLKWILSIEKDFSQPDIVELVKKFLKSSQMSADDLLDALNNTSDAGERERLKDRLRSMTAQPAGS